MERTAVQQSNVDLVARAAPSMWGDVAADDHFAPDFVFHFFNPQLPDLAGDHHGLDGVRSLFAELRERSDTGFRNQPHSLTRYGDELVVAYATNTVGFGGVTLDVDAIVVWRVIEGRIHEAWDIPAVNTVRMNEPNST